jgi:flavin-dependent dehydrogenase
VTVYDPTHPRKKSCGGGVTPGVFLRNPELQALLPKGRPAHHVRMRSPGGIEFEIELPRPIQVFARRTLDAALLERALAAGATLCTERVRGVSPGATGVSLQVGDRVRRHEFVVGADGAASVVRRSLIGESPGGRAMYATAGFRVSGLEEDGLYVEFVPEWAGYFWVFPRPDHASVGIVCPVGRENGRGLRARVLALLERRYPGSGALERVPYGAVIPCPTTRQARVPRLGGPRFGLVGDAALAVDAITGEGIQHALESGAMLAGALEEAGPLEAAGCYARRWRSGPGRDLAVAARWAQRYYRPASVEFAFRVARRSRRARRVMGDLLTAMQPYSRLRRRLLSELLAGSSSG